ncbi:MAG: dihydroorotate dehydrogenase [Rubripirellula sp.]|nr:dihydroorotate dehydrogenase [Rubripirellula sp.]
MHQDVTTRYMGLPLRSPILVGACPLTLKPEMAREVAIAGAGAAVMPSLMEEQVSRWFARRKGDASNRCPNPEAELCKSENVYNGGVESCLKTIPRLKRQCGIPIIASLNGGHDGDWLSIAGDLEAAGVDAIELIINANTYDPDCTAEQAERPLLDAVRRVTQMVSIPVAVKLLPFYSTLPNLAARLREAGAKGIVLFGREPIWEISDGDLVPALHWHLSSPGLLQTTLSGLIRVRGSDPSLSIAASGGIATTLDVVHAVVGGADVTMVTSELYRSGPDVIAHLVEGLSGYLHRNGFNSYCDLIASRQTQATDQDRQAKMETMLAPPETEEAGEAVDGNSPHGDRWGHLTTPTP